MFEACVIGCGQIGSEVLRALHNQYFDKYQIIGTDVSAHAIERLEEEGFKMTNALAMPEAKVYFICVWDTSAVRDLLYKLQNKSYIETIFIETTIDPTHYEALSCEIDSWSSDLVDKVVFFPHRFNPNDKEHNIFNQKRVLGACSPLGEKKAMEFLRQVMASHLLELASPEIAVMAKVVENAYRAMEIILAQEIKSACEIKGVDFPALIRATNSKWNINIKEARDGVKGKCLPKDLGLYNKYFNTNGLSKIMEALNNEYISKYKV